MNTKLTSLSRTLNHVKHFFILSSILLFIFLCGCAGLLDYDFTLPGGYELVHTNAKSITINQPHPDPSYHGKIVIDSYVNQIAFDNEYIFAQRLDAPFDIETNRRTVDYTSPPEYYILVIGSGEVVGPFDESQFNAWYAELNRTSLPTWIPSTNQKALSEEMKALPSNPHK